ncbi:MAG TPA: polyamine aminopropyltransferase [Aquabacterium sp.]|uniref:polyamine aminopropyltransferase n=1 Tax=Aquabacterium sp. TaxID=1872578 RepID=UPI002E3479A3|nr:polyamine aminopropyltransferase [Aquabacterium sp.]HEX5371309.1 polyamine aminopropyltransferase [Aquabacterium sp.]
MNTVDEVLSPTRRERLQPAELVLLVSVFLVAACGLVYELAAGALASYLLGDSILQFSTVIGTYLFAMGVGSWLSRFLVRQLVAHFLRIELLVGLIGGLMPAALFAAHAVLPVGGEGSFRVLLYGLVFVIGTLVGLEIPLVMRILKRHFSDRYALKDLVSEVLTFDYLGALAVSLAFPLLLVPHLGVVRTGVLFGLLNAAVAAWALMLFRHELRGWWRHALACAVVVAILAAAMVGARPLTTWAEDRFYGSGVVLREDTPYQRIVITQSGEVTRLYLNGNLQFSSRDEHRYHEALVHPAMSAHGAPRRVLVLGGGDGLAVREILKYPSVQQVTLVELDPAMTRLFSQDPRLVALNQGALRSSKVRVVHADAFTWLNTHDEVFDVIVVDFPDPTNHAVGKLYTTTFYAAMEQHLSASGYAVVQTTSPLIARRSFWTVVSTLEAVGLRASPYHAHVPSFGEWGFVLAHHRPWRMPTSVPAGLTFLTAQGLPALFDFPPDMNRVPAEANRLSQQSLVQIFEEEWGKVQQ